MDRAGAGGVVLLTGGTGFLGTQIARCIVSQTEHRLIVLVRASDATSARRRLARAAWDWPELRSSIGDRVQAVAGDVAQPRLGLDEDGYGRLIGAVTHIIHAAGDTRLLAPVEALRSTNVDGVAHIIELARAVDADHGLQRLAHISTAYVAGRRNGVIPEGPPTSESGFANAYEQSKYDGECLVQQVRADLPVSIFRPAMIVGDSETGAVRTFNTVYYPIRRYLMGRARLMVGRSDLPIDIVPVDYVADAVARLTFDPRATGLTFHLTPPPGSRPTAAMLVDGVRAWAEANLGVRLPRPMWLPLPLSAGLMSLWDRKLRALLPYFDERREFRRDGVDRLLGPYRPDWRVFLPRLLDHAAARAFMHSSERTVHEQVVFRLGSHAGSVTFHDLVEGRDVVRSAVDVRGEMLTAAGALRALGVEKGSRVAIVGLNSTRYLSLDVAIGLCGAVSVPLYYTSPPAELDAIIRASRAQLLLVGAPAILERLAELSTSIPVVSFWRGPLPSGLHGVMTWEAFLAHGADDPGSVEAPVDLGDVATLRYTSGTTGPPKGVVFTHAQLRWMAQAIVSVLPWRTRTGRTHYLSFLPMNHVVEGILCTYASYDLPGATDIYFLEEFHALAAALVKVRPTVFFGVPRLYEKALARLSDNRLGRHFLSLPDGLERRVLRRVMLRRMGLDRCTQLLVGSAPPGEALLRAYQRVGIEIHDAYGMTEAPLVTFNRLGRNRIGTAGEPLPDTEVRIASDGEILARGPQVSLGYDDPAVPSPVEDGWLHTGDVGHLTEDGYLVVDGRRKEMIATSYAKKIAPAKVEVLLRAIPGVAEAMLVGDGRPYCAALVWVDDANLNHAAMDAIDQAVSRVGLRLAPPERPRRWAILRNDLSAERGDLTANLKLRRQALIRRYASVIDELYGEHAIEEAGIHVADVETMVGVGA